MIEAIPHFAWGHRHHPGGGQFDGQGNPVEALTNLSNCGGFITADYREARCNALSALDEKARRRRVDSCAHVQRGHQPQLLVGDPQSFAAGGQDPHRRRMREYGFVWSAAAASTCSQLSITNSRTRPSNAAATDSLTVLPGCWMMPRTADTASGTAARSVTAVSSKNQTPSRNSSASRAATSVASRVLPTPPHRSMSPTDVGAAPLSPRRLPIRARRYWSPEAASYRDSYPVPAMPETPSAVRALELGTARPASARPATVGVPDRSDQRRSAGSPSSRPPGSGRRARAAITRAARLSTAPK